MTRLSDEELRRLRFDLESELVERKRSGGDRSAIRRNICAFANDLPGYGRPGVILVGVEDDGRCAGLEIDDELLRTFAQMRDDGNILPLRVSEHESADPQPPVARWRSRSYPLARCRVPA